MTELEQRACDMRIDIVRMIAEAGSGHPGGSLSCTDILTALYFGGVMEHDPEQPSSSQGACGRMKRLGAPSSCRRNAADRGAMV